MAETISHTDEVLSKEIDPNILRRLLSFFRPYKKFIIIATILTITISALAALRPRLTPIAIDEKIANNDMPGLQFIVLIMLGTLVFQGVIQYVMTYLTSWIGQKIIFDLRRKIFQHILTLDLKYFDKNPIGRIVTRVTGDVEVLFEVFSSGLVTAFGDIFLIIWILFFMFDLDVKLTFAMLAVLPVLVFATSIFRKKVRESYRRIRILVAKLNSFIQEHISGISIVQYFAKEKKTIDEFEKINREHTEQNKKSVFYYAVFFPIVELISAIAVGLIIWYGGGQVVQNAVSIGVIVSFIQFTEMFFRPIRDLSEKYNILQTAMASSERIFELLDEKPAVVDPQEPKDIGRFKGDIEFKDVWFAYNKEDYVLKNVSFKISEGEKVAFVGATGAGKTTIISLLTRFYDVTKGQILIDGIDIREFAQKELRKNIAVVLQDVFLFSGDIYSNITLNNPDISEKMVSESVKNAGLDEFLSSMPEGLGRKVNERGSTLSVGQKQLV